jgi:hypothetical protein
MNFGKKLLKFSEKRFISVISTDVFSPPKYLKNYCQNDSEMDFKV